MESKEKITKELINKLEKSTGLLYKEQLSNTNVCYSTSNSELRDEYKQIFTMEDVRYFIAANPDIDSPSGDEFWKWVKKGKNIR